MRVLDAFLGTTPTRILPNPATGRSEFVLVRAPAQRPLPICRGLEMVGRPDGLTPLLVGEVELTMNFFDQIWQPLSLALELLKRSPAQTRSVW